MNTPSPACEATTARRSLYIKTLVAVTASILAALGARGELIPSARLSPWRAGVTVGVPGGIPTTRTQIIDVTKPPYNADRTGATDAAPAIQAALNEAAANSVVFLPAGTYRLNAGLTFSQADDHVTLRGAGMDQTILAVQPGVNVAVGVGTGYSFNYPANGIPLTGGNQKGSTVISMADTSAFSVDTLVQLHFEEQIDSDAIRAGAVPIVSVSGFNFAENQSSLVQVSRIVGKTATSLTISPGIIRQHDPGLAAKAFSGPWNNVGMGVEDLTIDCSAGNVFAGVYLQNTHHCWVKGVKVSLPTNYGIYFQYAAHCEVRQSDVRSRKGAGSNGAGLLVNSSTGCLFEDNIIYDLFPCVEVNHGSNGNVFAYNLLENPPSNGFLYDTLIVNHGPHNTHNLYEGNIASNFKSDGYFGGASEDTMFRNWLHGTYRQKDQHTFVTAMNRFTRNYSLVGNILGTPARPSADMYSMGNPNIGNAQFSGTAQPTQGDFWADWKMTATLTTRTSSNSGAITLDSGSLSTANFVTIRWNGGYAQFTPSSVSGNVVSFSGSNGSSLPAQGTGLRVFPGPAGYQERDLDVAQTTILKANYNLVTGAIPAAEALGGDVLPPSLYLTEKPAWFGSLAWPPIDPLSPNPAVLATGSTDLTEAYKTIPAGYRFVTGGGDRSAPTAPRFVSNPQNVTVNAGGNASFSVVVEASPAATLQWQVSADGGDVWTNLANAAPYSGATSSTLSIANATTALNGNQYRALATNSAGTAQSTAATLTVSDNTTIAPTITAQPSNQTVTVGGNTSFTVATSGTPAPSIRWQVSPDAINWTDLTESAPHGGTATATLTITGATLALNAHRYRAVATNTGGTVTSNPALLTVNPLTADLPLPWQALDIGPPPLPGSTVYEAGKFILTGAGSDIWGASDEFHYAFQSATGDCEVIARVDTVEHTNSQAKAGIMIRESQTASSRYAGVFVTPGSGIRWQHRGTSGGSTSATRLGGVAPPQWLKLTRKGNTFTAYASSDGLAWRQVESRNLTMSTTVNIGLAVTPRKSGVRCTATMGDVTVVP